MKKAIIILFLILPFVRCGINEGASLQAFTENFIADSTGSNGFRKESITFPDDTTALINGINIIGYTHEKIIELLGKPNKTNDYGNGNYGLWYAIGKGGMGSKNGLLIFVILFENKRVSYTAYLLTTEESGEATWVPMYDSLGNILSDSSGNYMLMSFDKIIGVDMESWLDSISATILDPSKKPLGIAVCDTTGHIFTTKRIGSENWTRAVE